MKTLGVLVIVIVTIIGILLMTALASRTMAPVHKVHTSPHSALKHRGSPSLGPDPYSLPRGYQKSQPLSPADAGDSSGDANGRPTSDAYSYKWDVPGHPAARGPSSTPQTPGTSPLVPEGPDRVVAHEMNHWFPGRNVGPGGSSDIVIKPRSQTQGAEMHKQMDDTSSFLRTVKKPTDSHKHLQHN